MLVKRFLAGSFINKIIYIKTFIHEIKYKYTIGKYRTFYRFPSLVNHYYSLRIQTIISCALKKQLEEAIA